MKRELTDKIRGFIGGGGSCRHVPPMKVNNSFFYEALTPDFHYCLCGQREILAENPNVKSSTYVCYKICPTKFASLKFYQKIGLKESFEAFKDLTGLKSDE